VRERKEKAEAKKTFKPNMSSKMNINHEDFDLAELVRDRSMERGLVSKDKTKFGRWECYCLLCMLVIICCVGYLKISQEQFG